MKLADLVKKQGGVPPPDSTGAGAAGTGAVGAGGPGRGSEEQLRKAATEVLRIFDTGVGNGGITASDWLMAMAELRAALGEGVRAR